VLTGRGWHCDREFVSRSTVAPPPSPELFPADFCAAFASQTLAGYPPGLSIIPRTISPNVSQTDRYPDSQSIRAKEIETFVQRNSDPQCSTWRDADEDASDISRSVIVVWEREFLERPFAPTPGLKEDRQLVSVTHLALEVAFVRVGQLERASMVVRWRGKSVGEIRTGALNFSARDHVQTTGVKKIAHEHIGQPTQVRHRLSVYWIYWDMCKTWAFCTDALSSLAFIQAFTSTSFIPLSFSTGS
jgi:hypothetical protein